MKIRAHENQPVADLEREVPVPERPKAPSGPGALVLVGEECDCIARAREGALEGRHLVRIRGGLECRRYLRTHTAAVVIVGPAVRDVSSLNLMAAISSDMACGRIGRCPIIYLFDAALTGSLSSRANSAGVTRVLAPEQLGEALAGILWGDVQKEDEPVCDIGRLRQEAAACPDPSAPAGAAARPADVSTGAGASVETMPADANVGTTQVDAGMEKLHVGACAEPVPAGTAVEAASSKVAGSGKVVSFVSGNGGSGRTTCALLTAIALDRLGARVALLDLDVQFGDLGCLFGRDDIPLLDGLVSSMDDPAALSRRIRSLSTSAVGDVVLFAAPSRPERGDLLTAHVPLLLDVFSTLFDVIVVDTGSLWDEMNVAILSRSDRVIGVCDQRASSLHMMSVTLDLCMRLGVPLVRLDVLLNRCDSKAPIDELSAQMALKGPKVVAVAEGGREVDELIGLGCPEDLIMLKNPCAKDVGQFAASLSAQIGLIGPAIAEESEDRQARKRPFRLFRKGVRA